MVERTSQLLYATYSTKRASPAKDLPQATSPPQIYNELLHSGKSQAYQASPRMPVRSNSNRFSLGSQHTNQNHAIFYTAGSDSDGGSDYFTFDTVSNDSRVYN